MRPDRDETWLDVAAVVARRSTCLRRAVGCVLLDDLGQVLATGYNGRARGLPHCNEPGAGSTHVDRAGKFYGYPHACVGARAESGTRLDACEAIHAEQNALLQCRDVRAIRTCYVTASPCLTCVKLLMQTGCQRIVFAERYAHDEAAQRLWLEHTKHQRPGAQPWHLFPKYAPGAQ